MDSSKEAVACEALKFVKKGQKVGLGTGSTTKIFIDLLGEKNRESDLELACVATSKATEKQAKSLGLKLVGFEGMGKLDVAFDGADKVDSDLNLIKGRGGALVREKIVDYRAGKFIVMVGEDKLVRKLTGGVPVEIIPMAEEAVKWDLLKLGARKFETRMDGKLKFVSDNSNTILHAEFPEIAGPAKLEDAINRIAGTVDNGIFTQNRPIVVVGNKDGSTRIL